MRLPARSRSTLSLVASAVAAAALSAAPAAAHAGAAPAAGCPDVPTLQPFSPWQDTADYFPAPDGGLEAGGAGWGLQGGARTVEGNEPFRVGAPSDHRALDLPAGSSATTAPMCIGPEHRTMRFFGAGTSTGALTVEAVYTGRNEKPRAVTLGNVRGTGAWAPSPVLAMKVNDRPAAADGLQVALRFTPRGRGGWRIDDVYVDPFRSR